MQFTTIMSFAVAIGAVAANSVQVNFYSDTGCRNFLGSRFIDYTQRGQHTSGGPSGSRGGLYVNSNNLGLPYRGFSNHADGSQPFTGNVVDGECIGTVDGLYAVFDSA